MPDRVVAPLVGDLKLNNFEPMDLPASAAPGLRLPSGKLFHFELMLPPNYDPHVLYPLLFELHPDQSGNNYYRGGGSGLGNYYGGRYRTEAFQRAHPCIVCVPYADQTGASSAIRNWGGWAPTGATASPTTFSGDSGPNTFAMIATVPYLASKYAVDLTRVYVRGFSLGGIGTELLLRRYNTVNGNPKIFVAGTTTGGVLEINGIGRGPNAADLAAIRDVPLWNISGQGDHTSIPTHWNTMVWDRLCSPGQVGHYPGFGASEAASRAGTTQYLFWDVAGVGHSATDHSGTYMEMHPTVLAWLFRQTSGAIVVGPPAPPPVVVNPSPDGTVAVNGNPPLVTDAGDSYGINAAAQIVTNGSIDSTTRNVLRLMKSHGDVYQQNNVGDWWKKTHASDPWQSTPAPEVTPPVTPPTPAPNIAAILARLNELSEAVGQVQTAVAALKNK